MMNVFRKALVLSSTSKTTSGELINLMADDSARHRELVMIGNTALSALSRIIFTVVYLFTLIQWSLLAPIGFTILMTPLNYYIITIVTRYQVDIFPHLMNYSSDNGKRKVIVIVINVHFPRWP